MMTQIVCAKQQITDFNDLLQLKRGFLKDKVVYLYLGILMSPAAMCVGFFRLFYYTSKISIQLFLRQVFENSHLFEKSNKTTSHLLKRWTRQVKTSLLLLVPFIGPQLSARYRSMECLSGFEKTPPLSMILSLFNLQIPQYIYLSDEQQRRKYPLNDNFTEEQKQLVIAQKRLELIKETYWQKKYLQLLKPSSQETSAIIDQAIGERHRAVQLRIPVEKANKTRFHDATLLFSPLYKKDAPTVVMYHGNKGHRDDFRDTETVEGFFKKGYNVLLSAYAGDYTTEYKDEDISFTQTRCKEIRMRQDAEADVKFLSKQLKVNRVAVYGYSLGGAQAMNFAQAVAKEKEKLKMDFVVLDKTFTKSWAVIHNTVNSVVLRKYNINFNMISRIAADVTKEHFFSETKHSRKKGNDGLNSKRKLAEVIKEENFQSTRFLFIGAEHDFLMGVQKTYDAKTKSFQGEMDKNFAVELFFLADLAKKPMQKVELLTQYKGDHCTSVDISSFIGSLQPITGHEEVCAPNS